MIGSVTNTISAYFICCALTDCRMASAMFYCVIILLISTVCETSRRFKYICSG